MNAEKSVITLLKAGVAFAFVYPAVSAYLTPLAWIGFFPPFILDLVPEGRQTLLLHAFGLSEVAIALWILFGRNIFVPSLLAVLYLGAIIFFNFALLDVIFRDIPILLMALALALWSRPRRAGVSG